MESDQEWAGHLTLRNLEPREQVSIYWGFLWRSFVMTLVSILAGAALGGIAGFLLQAGIAIAGASPEAGARLTPIAAGLAGVLAGIACLILYINWLFRAKIGHFRLALIRSTA